MKQITIVATTTKVFNIHPELANDVLKKSDLYELDNFTPEQIKSRGFFLVSSSESVDVNEGVK